MLVCNGMVEVQRFKVSLIDDIWLGTVKPLRRCLIWVGLFRLKFPFRFHSDSGYSGLWPTEIWSNCHSWLAHFKPRSIFYIEDILSQGSFLVVVLLTNRSKWITMLIERASSVILFFSTLFRGFTRRKKRAVFALRASSARQFKLLILLNIGG